MLCLSRTHVLTTGLVFLTACSSSSAQQARAQTATDIVATVGSTSITLGQVDEKALQMPASNFGTLKLLQALYEARRAALEDLVGNALIDQEAKARGVDRAALAEREIMAKASPVTEPEVAAWYQANKGRVQGATLEQVQAPIKNMLSQERTQAAREEYLNTLKAKASIKVTLEPPRLAVAEAGRPARGPKNAPIQMIEFSDFQCPYCISAYPTLMKVLDTYGDRIRFTYRHYPLTNHPNARPAAEAAQCANEQDKFWAYHDKLFRSNGRLSDSDLKEWAAQIGVDAHTFNACVDSHKYKADVDADIVAGDQAGVSGTPAFFINGRVLTGAQPLEAFKRLIDEELALKQAR